jgi:hypothetical protein
MKLWLFLIFFKMFLSFDEINKTLSLKKNLRSDICVWLGFAIWNSEI